MWVTFLVGGDGEGVAGRAGSHTVQREQAQAVGGERVQVEQGDSGQLGGDAGPGGRGPGACRQQGGQGSVSGSGSRSYCGIWHGYRVSP